MYDLVSGAVFLVASTRYLFHDLNFLLILLMSVFLLRGDVPT